MQPSQDKQEARQRLAQAAVLAGFPEEFGIALADYLGGPKTMDRMSAYLVGVRPQTIQEAADEAVSLMEQRARWVETIRGEEANAAYTRWVNRPDRPQE